MEYQTEGPWSTEPDELDWTDAATGMRCKIRRVRHSGHLCGYVCVPEGHPLHGVSYSAQITKTPPRALFDGWYLIEHDYESPGGLFSVHGGITYSEQDDDGYWYGFDCAHCDDLRPASRYAFEFGERVTYRDLEYVKEECASLAAQLHRLAVVPA